jgi:hypothetical protein
MKNNSHTRLKRLTNVFDLLDDGVENGSDLAPTSRSEAEATAMTIAVEKPSTTDPFAVAMAEADMAEAAENASPGTRRLAWALLAAPSLLYWAIAAFLILTDPGPYPPGTNFIDLRSDSSKLMDTLFPWILVVGSFIPSVFWPYILLRGRRRK